MFHNVLIDCLDHPNTNISEQKLLTQTLAVLLLCGKQITLDNDRSRVIGYPTQYFWRQQMNGHF